MPIHPEPKLTTMNKNKNTPKESTHEQPIDKGLDAVTCSLLVWTPNPENPREILGRSKRAPGITLYIIELMETRNDRGRMLGAFMTDELEREGLYDKALVHWLKWEAESQMREFLEIHSANAKSPSTGATE